MNKRKILESARKLAQKGAKDKALKEYQKLLKLDPKDAKLRLEIGDAHRRWGQVDEAIDTYTRVAEQYMDEGFDARAVAVFKQILNLDPDRFEAYSPLAELYERMGLAAEAIGALQTAADGFHRQGRKDEALELLRKMANADPSNTTSRIKVADLLRQEGRKDDAIAEYRQAAAELERQGDVEMRCNVYRRVLECDDKDVEALSTLAEALAGRGKVAEALPLSERALQLDSANPERHEAMAGLYERAGRPDEAAATWRGLADLYRERGDEDTARGILQRHVPASAFEAPADLGAEPPDELSGAGLLGAEGGGESSGLFGDEFPDSDGAPELALDFGNDELAGAPGAGGDPLLDTPLTPGDDAGADDGALDLDATLPPAAARSAPASAGADAGESFDAEQLLAEASVYLRYGKRDKAIAHLERVVAAEPDHRGALEKLGEAFAESGQDERAVDAWLRAAKRADADDDSEGVRVLRGRIAALDPDAAVRLDAPAGASEGVADVGLELGAEDDLEFDDDELLATDEDDVLVAADDEVVAPADDALGDPADDGFEMGTDDGFEMGTDDELAVAAADELAVASDDDPGAAPVAAVDVRAASASAGGNSLSAETRAKVLEDLEEADFYMQQGLLDEAEEIYQRVLAVAPSHPRALVRLGEVAAARGEAPGAATPGAADPEAEGGSTDEFVFEDDAEDEAPLRAAREEEEVPIDVAADALEDPEPALEAADEVAELSDLDLSDVDGDGVDAEDADATEGEADGSDTQELAPAAAGASAEPAEIPDGSFDLAAALADAFDDDPSESAAPAGGDGFEAVFDAFKKGVSETLGAGDHQAHYDLAIAYKEMGLLDDAIDELRVAMGDASRTAECLHLIGLCAIDADQAPLAVEHLEQLLELPGLAPEAALAGRFDLGRALRAVGDRDGARREWEAVVERRPDFQDVRQRLAALDDPDDDGAEPGKGDDDGADFESFDDVMEAVSADEDEEEAPPDPGETFDDLVAEANAGDEEPDEDPEPEPAAARARPTPRPKPPRKKKKISFV